MSSGQCFSDMLTAVSVIPRIRCRLVAIRSSDMAGQLARMDQHVLPPFG